MNYKIDTGFEDGTTVRIETTNRKLFFRIEEIINDFQFTNEEPNGIEQQDNFQNELDLNNGIEKTQNNGNEERGIELDKTRGIEPQSSIQNSSEKNRGNELQSDEFEQNTEYNCKLNKIPIVIRPRMTKLYPPIYTKYGKAYLDKGYYRIRDKNSKYNNKALHRIIYEEHHKCTILPNYVIHHKDGNKVNNNINNLILMSNSDHSKLHNIQGDNIPEYTFKQMLAISKSQNKSGYFRVSISKANNKQGFKYKYQYYENGVQKSISSKNIRKLERKVKRKGLPWKKL